MRILTLAAVACCIAISAQADIRPKVLPDRDVIVTYRSGTMTDRVSYSASQGIFRRMHNGQSGFMLLNTRDHTMRVVSDRHRATVLIQGGLAEGPYPWDKAMQFRRVRQDIVAGVACTEWQMTMSGGSGAPADEPARIRLSADGIILRFGDNESGEVATAVAYGQQDPAGFRVPAGYRTLSPAEAMQLE